MARAGQQLWNVDSFSEDDPRPLLEVMADPGMSPSVNLGPRAHRMLLILLRVGFYARP